VDREVEMLEWDGGSQTAYKFIYSMFHHRSSSQPDIIDQPQGAIMILQGKDHLYGNQINASTF
jgi:hypothetical protein